MFNLRAVTVIFLFFPHSETIGMFWSILFFFHTFSFSKFLSVRLTAVFRFHAFKRTRKCLGLFDPLDVPERRSAKCWQVETNTSLYLPRTSTNRKKLYNSNTLCAENKWMTTFAFHWFSLVIRSRVNTQIPVHCHWNLTNYLGTILKA